MSETLTIGEVAARSGVATSALRFYEARGLLRAERTATGHRRYPRAAIRRVAFIVFAQRVGLTLDEVAHELAQLPANRVPERLDWGRLSRGWSARIDARIAELERLRVGLTACIGCGCLSLDRCGLANPGDRAGRRGPGPRYWVEADPAGSAGVKGRRAARSGRLGPGPAGGEGTSGGVRPSPAGPPAAGPARSLAAPQAPPAARGPGASAQPPPRAR